MKPTDRDGRGAVAARQLTGMKLGAPDDALCPDRAMIDAEGTTSPGLDRKRSRADRSPMSVTLRIKAEARARVSGVLLDRRRRDKGTCRRAEVRRRD